MTTGTVARVLPNGSAFICPHGVPISDRSKHLYCHHMALKRSGIPEISAGRCRSRISVQAARWK